MVMNDHFSDDFSMLALASKPIHGDSNLSLPSEPRREIPWRDLIYQRGIALSHFEDLPKYLLKPEVKAIINAETDPTYRLALEILWKTGARISEVLAITPHSFEILARKVLHLKLKTLKSRGRPTKQTKARVPSRLVPILDEGLKQRIRDHIKIYGIKLHERLFKFGRHVLNKRLKKIVNNMENPFCNVSCHTLRHSFAIHLVLHTVPLKYISQILGHKNLKTTDIYTQVLTVDGSFFLEGIDFD